MGFASCYEDNLDARGESVRSRHRRLTPPKEKTKKTQQIGSMESQFRLRRSVNSTSTLKPSRLKPSRPKPLQSKPRRPKLLEKKTSPGRYQRIRRRESQGTQYARAQKTLHFSVTRTQRVTTEEIQRRIQREIVRQSSLEE